MPFPPTIPALTRALHERGYEEPTPVQLAVLQTEEPERDLLVSAQTGSGKTVAYGLAIAKTLLGDREQFGPAAAPLALIISPTRELALQVQKELIWLYAHTGAHIVTCVGGMDIRAENRSLERGAHIVVGTPGRLRDHIERNRLDTSQLKTLVLDEADEMLNLGFREDLEFILEETPVERRTLLFSATIAKNIAALAKRYQHNALRVEVSAQNESHSDIEYRAIRIAPTDIEHAVVNVLRFYETPTTLIFCSTREAVRRLQSSLLERGFSVVALSGELSQKERNTALQALREGHARVCVATDVAARGIDIADLRLVIHADLPKEKETLQHRSGRTGRAGKKGTCILLVPYTRRRMAERLFAASGIEITWATAPSVEDIRQLDRDRLIAKLSLVNEDNPEDLALAQTVMAECPAETIALALVRLYSERLPSPEELIDHAAQPESTGRGATREMSARDRWRDGPSADTVWFRINIGRANNADPRWLLPMICRLGRVTKRDIGVIRIRNHETCFEIVKPLAEKFASSVNKVNTTDKSSDEEIHVERLASVPPDTDRRTERKKFDRPSRKRFDKGFAKPGGLASGKRRSAEKATTDHPYDKSEERPKTTRLQQDEPAKNERKKKPAFHKKATKVKKKRKSKDSKQKSKKTM